MSETTRKCRRSDVEGDRILDDLKNVCIALSIDISKLTNQVLILEIITAVISIQGVTCFKRN